MQIDYQQLCQMLNGAIQIVCLNCNDLSLLDAEIGDGDHGVTMKRAMEKMGEVITKNQTQQISQLLGDISWALMDIDGGAVGPLYGSLFLGMSEATVDKSTLDCDEFATMFEGGLSSIQEQTKARVGDKTLMDALIPSVAALRLTAEKGNDILSMLDAAANAAQQGAEATKNFPAKFGRAKYQGDRTLGKPDPGSVSMALVFKGFNNGLND